MDGVFDEVDTKGDEATGQSKMMLSLNETCCLQIAISAKIITSVVQNLKATADSRIESVQ